MIIKDVFIYIRVFLRRVKNRIGLYSYKTQNGIIKCKKPILGGADVGSYFDPCVIKVNNVFYMYVSCRKNKSIELFISTDGVAWMFKGIVLSGLEENCWCERVNRPYVIYLDNKFLLWFTGQDKQYISSIGFAISNDGLLFSKREAPVLKSELSFEGKSVMNPVVRFFPENGIFKMWYSSGDSYEPDIICYAESFDGITWSKKTDAPVLLPGTHKWDLKKVSVGDVVCLNDEYFLFYIGYSNIDTARICVAKSNDGINWEKDSSGPLISPSKNSWDADSCYRPSVLFDGNKWTIWYNGRKKRIETIGYAIKKDR